MTTGLGAFASGLQSGIQTRDRMDLNKEVKRSLANKNDMADRDWENYVDLTRQYHIQEEGSAEGFNAPQRTQLRDPALIRLGKWMKQRVGGFGGDQPPAFEQQAVGMQASGARTTGIPNYADGGAVDEERMARSYGEYYVPEAEAAQNRQRRTEGDYYPIGPVERTKAGRQPIPTSGGGPTEFMKDMGRHAGEYFDDTQTVALEGDKDVLAGYRRMRDADSPAEAGAGFSDWAVGSTKAGLATGVAVAKDAFIDNPITQFVGGALGFDGGGDAASGGIPEPVPGPAPAAAAAVAETNPAPQPDEQIAQSAIQGGEAEAIENLDYKLLVDQGVSPDELPSMSTQDWSDYRRAIFKYELGRGASASEALKAVDDMTVDQQMRGFQREGRKATLYLQSGQAREAAMALRQAYQYFPNGVGVKFGTAQDPKTGQPTIVAMGMDEQSGETTGKPMLITTERLSTMMENMSNPSAFRTWTKDGRELQMEIAKLESVDEYRKGSLEVGRANAITDRLEAETDAAEGIDGRGMTNSEQLAASKWYVEQFQEAGLLGQVDEEVMGELASLAAQVGAGTSKQPAQIIEEVTSAWLGQDGGRGGEAGLIEYVQRLQGR